MPGFLDFWSSLPFYCVFRSIHYSFFRNIATNGFDFCTGIKILISGIFRWFYFLLHVKFIGFLQSLRFPYLTTNLMMNPFSSSQQHLVSSCVSECELIPRCLRTAPTIKQIRRTHVLLCVLATDQTNKQSSVHPQVSRQVSCRFVPDPFRTIRRSQFARFKRH